MKNVVLGATGSLGRAVVNSLMKSDENVTAFIRNKSKAERYFNVESENFKIVTGDASSKEDVVKASEGADNIFYCIHVPYQFWEKEARELLKVTISAALKINAKLIFPGNVYVYGLPDYNPVDEKHPWKTHTKKGKIRIEMEMALRAAKKKNGLKYTVIRMPDFYGPYVINGLYEKIFFNSLEGKTIQWYGDLDIPIEFIYIADAGEAIVCAALSPDSDGEESNVPGYSVTTGREFLQEIAGQTGKGSRVKTINSSLIIGLGGLVSPLAREFKEMLYLKQIKLILNGNKFSDAFGSIPATPYKEGIAKTLDWARKYKHS